LRELTALYKKWMGLAMVTGSH